MNSSDERDDRPDGERDEMPGSERPEGGRPAGEGPDGERSDHDRSTEEQFALENLMAEFEADSSEPSGASAGEGSRADIDTAEFDAVLSQALDLDPEEPDDRPAAGADVGGRSPINAPNDAQADPDRRPSDSASQDASGEHAPQGAATSPGETAAETLPGDAAETSSGDTAETSPGDAAEVAPDDTAESGPDDTAEHEQVAAGTEDAGRTEVLTPVGAGRPLGPTFGPDGLADQERPPRRPRLFLSFFLAAVLIIGSVAGASSATVILYLGDIASKLRENSLDVGGAIVPTSSGEPQTILLVGTDKRSSDTDDRPPLSDTAMLLRLDPNRDEIAMMSIPRDLKVEIPGHGIDKFNAAYAYGGPELTLRTIRRLTGLDVNHIVNVDFVGFIRVIDEINCIYINVDRRYFNSNEGVPEHLQYAEIDIEPGYQKLCGEKALDYARYRHTDSDLVRAARQQEVIREARQRVPIGKLISDRNRLIEIFTDYTTSDIHETGQIIELVNLIIDARNASATEIHFPGVAEEIVPGQAAYVIADPGDVRAAVDRFLGFEASGGPRGAMARDTGDPRAGRAERRLTPQQRRRQHREHRRAQRERLTQAARAESDGLVDAAEGGREVALTAAGNLGPTLPVFYPRRLPSGTIYVQEARIYHVRDPDDATYGAYTFVLQLQPQGDFFNVQGIRGWADPPILDAPHEVIEMRNREYKVYLDGDRIRLIAWHIGPNTYWVSNSLLQTLTNDQMMGMARTMGVVVPKPKSRAERLAILAGRE